MQKNLKVAILHAFFIPKGGGEKLIFDIRNYYNADLFTGAIDHKIWDINNVKTDSFAQELYNPKYNFYFLHEDSKIFLWRKIKRQFFLKYHPRLKKLNNYSVVIFSGNIAGVMDKITNPKTKKIIYCHTPPRPFTDQFTNNLKKIPIILHPIANLFKNWVLWEYKKELQKSDLIIANSYNIQKRLQKYLNLDSKVIQPAINTKKFKYIKTGDYYLSYARLEDLKRIPLIIEAFKQMPEKKLIICSSGPLKESIQKISQLYPNIEYRGLVSNKELYKLVGDCLSGIYIPVEEDFGIIQCELMAAGKPVIGVREGGLLETVIDKKTGILIPANPTVDNLIKAVSTMTPKKAISMKENCIKQSQQFDSKVFFKKMNQEIEKLI